MQILTRLNLFFFIKLFFIELMILFLNNEIIFYFIQSSNDAATVSIHVFMYYLFKSSFILSWKILLLIYYCHKKLTPNLAFNNIYHTILDDYGNYWTHTAVVTLCVLWNFSETTSQESHHLNLLPDALEGPFA